MCTFTYMTDLRFTSLSCFWQGARGFDGEPGPQGLPGAPVSSFPSTRCSDSFLAIINDRVFATHICVQVSFTCE